MSKQKGIFSEPIPIWEIVATSIKRHQKTPIDVERCQKASVDITEKERVDFPSCYT